jgi:hypothetical protein
MMNILNELILIFVGEIPGITAPLCCKTAAVDQQNRAHPTGLHPYTTPILIAFP